MARKFNRFEKGSGCFECCLCHKNTRRTAGSYAGMCELCVRKSENGNSLSDSGYTGADCWTKFDNCKTPREADDLLTAELAN